MLSSLVVQVMLDAVLQYVEAVLDGTQEPDTSVGRALNDMVRKRVVSFLKLLKGEEEK